MVNNTKNHKYAVIAIAAAAGLGPACAQEPGKVMIDVADCIKLDAPEARLACYESRVAAVFGERAAQAAAARPAPPAPPAVASSRPQEPAVAASAAPTPTPPPAAAPVPASPATSPPAPTGSVPVRASDSRQSRREEETSRAGAEAAANDVVSRVKELREVLPNAWQITLENGQVWRQTVSKHYELRPGAQVKIYGTRWGRASRLSAEEINGYIQVERVR